MHRCAMLLIMNCISTSQIMVTQLAQFGHALAGHVSAVTASILYNRKLPVDGTTRVWLGSSWHWKSTIIYNYLHKFINFQCMVHQQYVFGFSLMLILI